MNRIYVIHDKRDDTTKIGISNNPERRLVELAKGRSHPETLSIFFQVPHAAAGKIERRAHSHFKSQGTSSQNKEWFSIRPEDATDRIVELIREYKLSKDEIKKDAASRDVNRAKRERYFQRLETEFANQCTKDLLDSRITSLVESKVSECLDHWIGKRGFKYDTEAKINLMIDELLRQKKEKLLFMRDMILAATEIKKNLDNVERMRSLLQCEGEIFS